MTVNFSWIISCSFVSICWLFSYTPILRRKLYFVFICVNLLTLLLYSNSP